MGFACEYITPFGCPARDTAKSLMLQELTEGSEDYKELSDICKKQCCKECEDACGYRCGRTYGWIPVPERLPDDDSYVLLSFENFTIPMIGRYERDEDGGGNWYIGDCEEQDTCLANDLFVNAWQPLPEPYKEENNEKD